jgi:hypothetical protein
MGRCDRRNHWWRSDWSCSRRGDWRRCRSCGRRVGRRSGARRSSRALRPATARRFSNRALGRNARLLLQSLHRSCLRSSRGSARWAHSRCRYRPAFSQTVAERQFSSGVSARSSARLRLQCIHERLHLLCHFQQFRPRPMIILAGQFARGIETHMRTDVLIGGRMVE